MRLIDRNETLWCDKCDVPFMAQHGCPCCRWHPLKEQEKETEKQQKTPESPGAVGVRRGARHGQL